MSYLCYIRAKKKNGYILPMFWDLQWGWIETHWTNLFGGGEQWYQGGVTGYCSLLLSRSTLGKHKCSKRYKIEPLARRRSFKIVEEASTEKAAIIKTEISTVEQKSTALYWDTRKGVLGAIHHPLKMPSCRNPNSCKSETKLRIRKDDFFAQKQLPREMFAQGLPGGQTETMWLLSKGNRLLLKWAAACGSQSLHNAGLTVKKK